MLSASVLFGNRGTNLSYSQLFNTHNEEGNVRKVRIFSPHRLNISCTIKLCQLQYLIRTKFWIKVWKLLIQLFLLLLKFLRLIFFSIIHTALKYTVRGVENMCETMGNMLHTYIYIYSGLFMHLVHRAEVYFAAVLFSFRLTLIREFLLHSLAQSKCP